MDLQKFHRIRAKIIAHLSEIEQDLHREEAISRAWRSMLARGPVCIQWTDCREFSRWLKSQNVQGAAFHIDRWNEAEPYAPENSRIVRK